MICAVVITIKQARAIPPEITSEQYIIDRFRNDYGVEIKGLSDERLILHQLIDTRHPTRPALAFHIEFNDNRRWKLGP